MFKIHNKIVQSLVSIAWRGNCLFCIYCEHLVTGSPDGIYDNSLLHSLLQPSPTSCSGLFLTERVVPLDPVFKAVAASRRRTHFPLPSHVSVPSLASQRLQVGGLHKLASPAFLNQMQSTRPNWLVKAVHLIT